MLEGAAPNGIEISRGPRDVTGERVTATAGSSRITERVASLEEQIVQFRSEVRDEFSATREELRQEIRAVDSALHKRSTRKSTS